MSGLLHIDPQQMVSSLKQGPWLLLLVPSTCTKSHSAGLRVSGPEMSTVKGETQWAVCDALCDLVLRDD